MEHKVNGYVNSKKGKMKFKLDFVAPIWNIQGYSKMKAEVCGHQFQANNKKLSSLLAKDMNKLLKGFTPNDFKLVKNKEGGCYVINK